MARGKKQTTDIPEPVVDETIETIPPKTVELSPVEVEISEELVPKVVIPEEKPIIPEPEKETSSISHPAVATMVPMPGGKYKVIVAGKKVLGMWGKEKAEQICRNYNK